MDIFDLGFARAECKLCERELQRWKEEREVVLKFMRTRKPANLQIENLLCGFLQ